MEGLQAPLVVACGSYRESDWVRPQPLESRFFRVSGLTWFLSSSLRFPVYPTQPNTCLHP